jgi:hypothetical protein
MLDICEPLFSEECLIPGVITTSIRETHGGALDIIDTVTDVHRYSFGIYDVNRCSCGSSQRVRVNGMLWRSGWNEPVNVNVKNTGAVDPTVVPLGRLVSAVPSNHRVSDALVKRRIKALATTAASRPAIRRVYDLVCLRILYDNAHGIQVGERKKENKRRREREVRRCRCTKGTCNSRHSERWYLQASAS